MSRFPSFLAAALACAGLALADGTYLGTNYCSATVNSSGGAAAMSIFGPDYQGSGEVFLDDSVVISAYPLPRESLGLFLYGTLPNRVPFGQGSLCVGGRVHRTRVHAASSFGWIFESVTLGDLPGLTPGLWHFQAWFRDSAGGPAGFNLSDGIALEISA
ncbi:MAG TPA: hypothetical protein VMT18_03385 [Planctomycetota bacterium]|nr:hypothetical protein [Planctomycetota bacterium]